MQLSIDEYYNCFLHSIMLEYVLNEKIFIRNFTKILYYI
jgi:hypothetical protein